MRTHFYTYGLAVLLMAGIAYAGTTADNKFKLNQHGGSAAHGTRLGTLVDQPGSLSVVWNASTGTTGSSTVSSGVRSSGGTNNGPVGRHNLGVQIPAKSLITRAWVEVTVPPITYTSAPTALLGALPGLSFHCSTKTTGKTTVDLSSSTLYSSAVASAGALRDLTAVDTIATMQRNDSTEDCEVQIQVEGITATSGQITLFVEYMQIR